MKPWKDFREEELYLSSFGKCSWQGSPAPAQQKSSRRNWTPKPISPPDMPASFPQCSPQSLFRHMMLSSPQKPRGACSDSVVAIILVQLMQFPPPGVQSGWCWCIVAQLEVRQTLAVGKGLCLPSHGQAQKRKPTCWLWAFIEEAIRDESQTGFRLCPKLSPPSFEARLCLYYIS